MQVIKPHRRFVKLLVFIKFLGMMPGNLSKARCYPSRLNRHCLAVAAFFSEKQALFPDVTRIYSLLEFRTTIALKESRIFLAADLCDEADALFFEFSKTEVQ